MARRRQPLRSLPPFTAGSMSLEKGMRVPRTDTAGSAGSCFGCRPFRASFLALAWLAGFTGALPAQDTTPSAPGAAPGVPAVPTGLGPPPGGQAAPPGGVWNDLVQQHHGYTRQIDQALAQDKGPPLFAVLAADAPDPRASCPWHFFAEGGFNMVRPYFRSNPILLVTHQGPGIATPSTSAPRFNFTTDFGPRVTLGAVSESGLGFRTSWWFLDGFDQETNVGGGNAVNATVRSVPVFGVPGFTSPSPAGLAFGVLKDALDFDNRIRLQVFDTEAFKDFRGPCWSLLISGGARYGYLAETYRGFRFNSGAAQSTTGSGRTRVTRTILLAEDSDVLSSGRGFEGGGPTTALELRRRLGAGFSAYVSARGSVLFGRERTRSFQRTVDTVQTAAGTVTAPLNSAVRVVQNSAAESETISMGDFEGGIDWTWNLGRVLLFAQVGLVNETWFGSGSATSRGGDTGFAGLHVSAGINY